MKRLKKCYYLILLTAVGIVYLSVVDQWKVYAQAARQVREFYLSLREMAPPEWFGEASGQDPGTEEQPGGDGAQGSVNGGAEDNSGGAEETPGGTPGEAGSQEQDTSREDAGTGEGPGGAEPPEQQEPVFTTVEDDYFSDALFIGDSRTVGMHEYGGLEEIATFYASTGLTVYRIFDSAIVEVPGQKNKITVEEALQANSFAKIYLMIGINEMGTGTVETFTEKYREVVEHLRELQPDAVIYIQGIIKVTTARSNQGDYINNEGIVARNLELEKLADNRRIFYLDVNPLICDETGGMVDSYTFDGVHLKAKYIQIWKDYLKQNAVRMDTLPSNTASANTVSSNTASANTVSSNTASANTVSPNTASANTASSNTVSANTVSSNTASAITISVNMASSNTISANTPLE